MATRGKQRSQVVQADRALAALAFTLCACVFNVFQFIWSKLLDISYGAEHSEKMFLWGKSTEIFLGLRPESVTCLLSDSFRTQ